MSWRPPEFTSEEFCVVLKRLGFVEKRKARHGVMLSHPNKTCTGKMPFYLIPNSVRNDKQFQNALVRDLIKFWDFTLEEIIEAFRK